MTSPASDTLAVRVEARGGRRSYALGDLADFVNGYPFKPSDWSTRGLPIIRIAQMLDPAAIADHYTGTLPSQYKITDGDLLFSWSGTLATVIWNRGPAWLNQHLFKVVPRDGHDVRFLHHLIDHIIPALSGHSHGSTMRHIKRTDLLPYRVDVPQPKEQERVAALLDLVDVALGRTERKVAALSGIRTGLLHDLVTSGIDVARSAPLESAAVIRFSSVDKLTEHGEVPVRLCNYTDVYKNTYINADMPFMRASASPAEIARFGLRVGDVIVTKDSETPDDIGVPAVVDSTAPDIVCGYHLAVIRPDLASLDPLFLAMQLKHTRLARYFGREANGSTRYGLSTRSIEQAPILRLPVTEQKRRSDVLREHDRAAAQVALEVQKLRSIKAGLMHDLLSGAVRIPSAAQLAGGCALVKSSSAAGATHAAN